VTHKLANATVGGEQQFHIISDSITAKRSRATTSMIVQPRGFASMLASETRKHA